MKRVLRQISDAKWLVDLTFQRRTPELAHQIRQTFGPDCIRVAQNHAKFALLGNEDWKIWISTSMNLNFNPRFENFLLRHDPEMYQFHLDVIAEIWGRQSPKMANQTPYKIEKHFRDDL
jgi:hypothetical protein